MPQITILYDTSYLMDVGRPFLEIEEHIEELIVRNGGEGAAPKIRFECSRIIQIMHVIPTEIKAEIVSHLNDPEKDGKARHARTGCSKIFALPNFEEISLSNIAPIEPIEKLLGPDSVVDKKLLAEAKRRIEISPDDFVFIATNDGGIKAEASLWSTKLGRKICTSSNTAALYHALENIIQVTTKHVKDEKMHMWEVASAERKREAGRNTWIAWRNLLTLIALVFLIPYCFGIKITFTYLCGVVFAFIMVQYIRNYFKSR